MINLSYCFTRGITMKELSRRTFFQQGTAAALGISLISTQIHETEAKEPFKRPYKPKMKLSLAGYSYRKYMSGDSPEMSILDFLDECAKMGLGASEPTSYYFPKPVTNEFLLKMKHRAHLLGIDISGTAIGNTFTYPKGSDRDQQLKLCNDWVDYSAIMGAPCIRIFAGKVLKGQTPKEAIKNTIETTQYACDYAAKKGVFLALENHGGIVAEPDTMLEIIDGVNSEWFGVNFDSGNFHTEDPYKSLAMIAPYTVNAQVKVHIRAKGKENQPADYDRIIGILAKAGYSGYVALEYEGRKEPKEEVPLQLKKLARAIAKVS
jgi:sugar phosphate isomerase/epimerase